MTREFAAGLLGRVTWTGAVDAAAPDAASAARTRVAPSLGAPFVDARLDVSLLHLADDVCAVKSGGDLLLLKRVAARPPRARRRR